MAEDTARGLQRERTALAWERTGIGFVVVGLLFVRAAPRPAWQVPGTGAVLLGVGLVIGGARAYARGPDSGRLLPPLAVRLVASAVVVLSLLAALMVLGGAT